MSEISWSWNRYARPVPRAPRGIDAQRRYRESQDRNPERTPLDPSAEGPREHLSRYLLARPWIAGRRVLDGGCGFAYGSLLIRCLGASQVVGLERDEDALRAGAMALRSMGKDRFAIRAECPPNEGPLLAAGDLERVPLPDRSMDLVLAFEVIEHLAEPRRFLSEARRVLTEAGLLLISTPNRELISPGWEIPPNRFHVREYSPDELRALLASEFPQVEMAGQRPGERLLRKRTHGRRGKRMAVSVERAFGFDPRRILPGGARSAIKRMLGDRKDPDEGGRTIEMDGLAPRIREWVSAGLEAQDPCLGGLYEYASADSGETLIALCHQDRDSVLFHAFDSSASPRVEGPVNDCGDESMGCGGRISGLVPGTRP
ncbi:MAG: methyltransferase domain-containing protein [Candidatus Eisenbacteria bacterium]|nr:methyltransferase domain-containing protein [Candidatus Eisenbacteria bacterium]